MSYEYLKIGQYKHEKILEGSCPLPLLKQWHALLADGAVLNKWQEQIKKGRKIDQWKSRNLLLISW